ncbi:hypothetical protein D6D00_08075 [Aureobasidium pullulans]|nr:hypothetical protein D6D00_08075 [Aureobasidium pullulans]
MSHIPKFHPTKKSATIYTEGPTKPLVSPPRKLVHQTVGFKLSYVLVFPRYHAKSTDIEEKAKDIVRHALKNVRFPSPKICKVCQETHEYSLPVSFEDPNKNEPKYTHWMVDIDQNAHLEESEYDRLAERCIIVGIQVISRRFLFHRDTPCPGDWSPTSNTKVLVYHNCHEKLAAHCWSTELKAVNEALLTLSKQPNYRVITNEYTDLKVYTGNGSKGVHLDVAKSLMGVFTAFERQFDTINITSRIGGGVRGWKPSMSGSSKPYTYISGDKTTVQEEAGESCKPMSSVNQSHMAANGRDPAEYDIPTFLKIFLRSKCDRIGLQSFLDSGLISHLNTVLDVSRVWDDKLIEHNPEYVKYCMKRPTITFRSQSNTHDYARQFAWIDFCGSLTDSCYEEDLSKVRSWLHHRWSEPHTKYTINHIIHHIIIMVEENIGYWRKTSARVTHPESIIMGPYKEELVRRRDAEIPHSDPVKTSKVPKEICRKFNQQNDPDNVRNKIKHKFDLGLYGKFPEETVIEFAMDHDEKWALAKGNYNHLILGRHTLKDVVRDKVSRKG